MIVNYAQLESKYVGETSKHIEIIFAEARKHGNVVVLFDEALIFPGLCIENVQQSYDTAINNTRSVMLMELSKFSGVIIFATNLVSNYDPAFRLRRISTTSNSPCQTRRCAWRSSSGTSRPDCPAGMSWT